MSAGPNTTETMIVSYLHMFDLQQLLDLFITTSLSAPFKKTKGVLSSKTNGIDEWGT